MDSKLMTHRESYDQQLSDIRSSTIQMGERTIEMVRIACEAVLSGNEELARAVVEADNIVDALEDEIIQKTVLTVMRESPVASDLRFLISTLGVLGEIERAADHAVKLARRLQKIGTRFPAELKAPLIDLGEKARHALAGALRLYDQFDSELAEEIISSDEVIDEKYTSAKKKILELITANPDQADSYLRTIQSFHALEHVADHAVEIAERLKVHHGPVRAA